MLQRTFWGFLLIAAGMLFLLDRAGLIMVDFGQLLRMYWPVLIIVAGLSGFVHSWRFGAAGAVWNLAVCAVGGILLLHNLNLTSLSLGEMFTYMGPIALILFGLSLMFRPSHRDRRRGVDYPVRMGDTDPHVRRMERQAERLERKLRRHAERQEWSSTPNDNPYRPEADEYISTYKPGQGDEQVKSGFIGDVILGQEYWELKPMTISHFIGDTVIDLTKAAIPYGETKLIVSAFIGDVKVIVPHDLDVEFAVTASSFIGDMQVLDRYESGFMRNLRTETPAYRDADRQIRLIVSSFIGDVLVRKVG